MSDAFVGEIRMFAGSYAPHLWGLCSGQLLPPSQNATLFSLLGTSYGGNGSTSFALPDLRGRVPVNQGNGPGLTPRNLGAAFGSETVTLTGNQIPAHRHNLQASQDPVDVNSPNGTVLATFDAQDTFYKTNADPTSIATMAANSVMNTGSNQGHYNLMPFQCLSFIICMTGIYPPRT